MAAFINPVQFGCRQQLMKFFSNHRWCYRIILTPYQANRNFDFLQLVAQIVAYGRPCQRNDLERLDAVIDNAEYLIYQLFGSHIGVVEGKFGLGFYIIVIAALGIGFTHTIFEQTRAAGKGDAFHQVLVLERINQANMTTERIAQKVKIL